MPLPKPPAKRAALLGADDFAAHVTVPAARRSTKGRAAAEPASPPVMDLLTRGAPGGTPGPAARRDTPAPATLISPPALRKVSPAAQPAKRPRGHGPSTLFVLDTNVLLHDPTSLFRFEEHDIYLPMITLEELDGHKRGMTEVARNARQVSRDLDALAANMPSRETGGDDNRGMGPGLALAATGHREAGGHLFFQTHLVDVSLPLGLPPGKADNQILGVVQALREQQKQRDV